MAAQTNEPRANEPRANELYVWRRDTTPAPRTWAKWAIGAMLALCAFGAFAAYMAEDNGSISMFLGLGVIVSLLIWFIPVVFDWGRRRNPDIRMEGREMVWAKVRVPIDQVDRWVADRSTTAVYNGTTTSRMTIGFARFMMVDGDSKEFNFPHLSEVEVEELATALEVVLPGRRVELG